MSDLEIIAIKRQFLIDELLNTILFYEQYYNLVIELKIGVLEMTTFQMQDLLSSFDFCDLFHDLIEGVYHGNQSSKPSSRAH